MEVVMGVLSSVITKLGELLVGEYNLQKEVKGGIKFLQSELESIQGALEKISSTPTDQLDNQDKIWARDVRELSYDIEEKVDTFIVRCRSSKQGTQHGFKKVIDRSLDLLMQPKIRRKIATDIRDIKNRVQEVSERRDRYKVNNNDVSKPVRIDPRLFTRYERAVELIGIDDTRDEVIKILGEDSEVSMNQDKIVSIVGFGGLGKTTLAGVVYEKVRAAFGCSAFVSVSQTPDMDKLFKDMFYQLAKRSNSGINVIEELRQFLENKRYLIVIDDIWDVNVWKMIKCALPHNENGRKIITTTRILSVGEQAGDVYKLEPLSLKSSRNLLYRRVFGTKNIHDNEDMENCPYEDLAIVSDKILKKCAGVPLAINTIASLLASKGKNKMEWYEVYNSIGTGMENSLDAENMRKILSYSYYDMTPHLRTCLLYLSVFPEDFEIEKDRLIWLWIAEGFVQCEEPGKSLFILGEIYFNELINRSMIQPVLGMHDDIKFCRVHDMVLDLIRFISSEENFVTVLSNMDHAYGSTMIRRLSIQKDKVHHVYTQETRGMPKVRSVVCFPDSSHHMPALRSFRILRVLDLEDCEFSTDYSLKYLGNLFHLRYLSLKDTNIDQLPEEVGNLQFLESLDVTGGSMSRLPLGVRQLKCLLCLRIDYGIIVSKGILGNLRSLEHLSGLSFPKDGAEWAEADIIEELGLLTKLRVLHLFPISDNNWNEMVECLRNLRNIQELVIWSGSADDNVSVLHDWVAPRHLRRLETPRSCWFSRLPSWMNASHLLDLCYLGISVKELPQEDLEVLGRLPALRHLDLKVDHENLGIIGRSVLHAGSFPCLVSCWLQGFVGPPMVFQQGAMSRVRQIGFDFYVREARETGGSDGGFDFGLANLPSLREVNVSVRSKGTSKEKLEEAEAAVRKEAETHPNRPILRI